MLCWQNSPPFALLYLSRRWNRTVQVRAPEGADVDQGLIKQSGTLRKALHWAYMLFVLRPS
jgi:hypothetical protein